LLNARDTYVALINMKTNKVSIIEVSGCQSMHFSTRWEYLCTSSLHEPVKEVRYFNTQWELIPLFAEFVRAGRRGDGVTIYTWQQYNPSLWVPPNSIEEFELLWSVNTSAVNCDVFIEALHHPPMPIYDTQALFIYVEKCLEALDQEFLSALIILAGDLNALSEEELMARTALESIVHNQAWIEQTGQHIRIKTIIRICWK